MAPKLTLEAIRAEVTEAATAVIGPALERIAALESRPQAQAQAQAQEPKAARSRKGTGKRVTGNVRSSVTTKAVDSAPSNVQAALTSSDLAPYAALATPKCVKACARAAAHSRDALLTYVGFGGRAMRAFIEGSPIPADAQEGQFKLVSADNIAYARKLDELAFGAEPTMPAPKGKRVGRSRKGSAQGSPSRGK